MNCKPGDLALVVMYCEDAPGLIGKIVRCIASHTHGGYPYWEVEPKVTDKWGRRRNVSDRALRPIRDPGDDAVDESKAWLPPVPLPTINPELIPSKEKA